MKHSKKFSTAKFQCQLHHCLFPVKQGSIFLDTHQYLFPVNQNSIFLDTHQYLFPVKQDSIFLDTHQYLFPVIQGSIFLDKWRKRPDQILSVGDVVVVATKGSSLFVFDAKSAQLVRKFDVFPSSQLLGKKV